MKECRQFGNLYIPLIIQSSNKKKKSNDTNSKLNEKLDADAYRHKVYMFAKNHIPDRNLNQELKR